jgi:NAD(P)H-nitrite reductase large subunit
MSRVCIDRCVCFQRSFDELLQIARRERVSTLEDLQEEAAFGIACRICNPYVRRMLKTGQTTFDTILTDDDEPRS